MAMKKIICTLAACVAVLVSCGPKSQIEDLKKDVQSLKEADAALWEEMSAAIDKLEQELLGRIQATKDKLNKTIDEAVADLIDLMDSKLGESQKYLQTELAAKKQAIDSHVEAVKGKTDVTMSVFDMSLETVQDFLLEQEALLRELEGKLDKMVQDVETAQEQIEQWQERLDQLQEDGLFDAIAQMQKDAENLKKFDIQKEVANMESRLEKFAAITLDDLTEDQMKQVQDMLGEMEDWYAEVENMVADGEMLSSEMESTFDDWQGAADDLYDQMDSYTSDLTDRLDYFSSFLEASYDEAISLEDDVNEWESYLTTLNDDLSDWSERIDSMGDDWEGQHDDLECMLDALADSAHEINDQASTLLDLVDEFIDSHPWMFD